MRALRAASCLLDGEAVAVDEAGRALLKSVALPPRYRRVVLSAFDLLELNGADSRGPLANHISGRSLVLKKKTTAAITITPTRR